MEKLSNDVILVVLDHLTSVNTGEDSVEAPLDRKTVITIKSFRLLSRRFTSLASPYFARAISDRVYRIIPQDLQVLLDVAQHPTLAPSIKSLRISCYDPSYWVCNVLRRMEEEPVYLAWMWLGSQEIRAPCAAVREIRMEYESVRYGAGYMAHSGMVTAILSVAMKEFQNLRSIRMEHGKPRQFLFNVTSEHMGEVESILSRLYHYQYWNRPRPEWLLDDEKEPDVANILYGSLKAAMPPVVSLCLSNEAFEAATKINMPTVRSVDVFYCNFDPASVTQTFPECKGPLLNETLWPSLRTCRIQFWSAEGREILWHMNYSTGRPTPTSETITIELCIPTSHVWHRDLFKHLPTSRETMTCHLRMLVWQDSKEKLQEDIEDLGLIFQTIYVQFPQHWEHYSHDMQPGEVADIDLRLLADRVFVRYGEAWSWEYEVWQGRTPARTDLWRPQPMRDI